MKLIQVLIFLLFILSASAADPLAILSKRADIYKKVAELGNSATVGINCKGADYSLYYGTGVIISSDGYILTSTTVVPDNAEDIIINLSNKARFEAKVVETNKKLESCLLKISSESALSHVSIARELPSIGERAYSFGNPHNMLRDGRQASFSVGVISGIYPVKSIDSQSTYSGVAIETDAAINPGQDGGPLLNCYGQLVGITSLSYGRNRWQGVAVPVKFIIDQLKHFKTAKVKLNNKRFIKPSVDDSEMSRGLAGHSRGISNKLVEIEVVRKFPSEYLKRLQLSEYIANIKDFYTKELREQQSLVSNFYNLDKVIEINQHIRRPSGNVTGLLISDDGYIITSAFNLDSDTVWLHKKKGLVKPDYMMERKKLLSFNEKDYDIKFNRVEKLTVKTRDGRQYTGKLISTHRSLGISLIKIEATKLPYYKLESMAESEAGDACAIIGIAPGKNNYTMNTGMVSAARRNRGQHLQFDASLNFGNSGGPVINRDGKLLGIAQEPIKPNPIMGRMFSEDQMLNWQIAPNSGASFAARTSEILKYLPRMKTGQTFETYGGPFMGLAPAQNSLLDKQVVISIVADNSPAVKAGFKKGDIIQSFNKKNVYSWKSIISELDTLKVGDTVDVSIKRYRPRLEIDGKSIENDNELKSIFKYLKDGQRFEGRFQEFEVLDLKLTLGQRK